MEDILPRLQADSDGNQTNCKRVLSGCLPIVIHKLINPKQRQASHME